MKHNKTIGVVAGLLVLGIVQVSQASLVTIGNVTDNGGGNYTIQSAAGSVPDATLESFLGLIPGTLDLLAVTVDPDLVTQGSALKKTQFMQAGDTMVLGAKLIRYTRARIKHQGKTIQQIWPRKRSLTRLGINRQGIVAIFRKRARGYF